MPGQRAPGQKLINVPVDEKFLSEIDSALKKSGCDNRAEFIREAIVEKLLREGYEVTAPLSKAPSRFGKGGRPPAIHIHHTVVNLAANSKKASASIKLLKKALPSAPKPDAK